MADEGAEKLVEKEIEENMTQVFDRMKPAVKSYNKTRDTIIKYSREITKNSKQVIGMLQKNISKIINGTENSAKMILDSCTEKLSGLQEKEFRCAFLLFQSLNPEEAENFLSLISSGIQEYIEAVGLLKLIKNNAILSFQDITMLLTFVYKVEDVISEAQKLHPENDHEILTTKEAEHDAIGFENDQSSCSRNNETKIHEKNEKSTNKNSYVDWNWKELDKKKYEFGQLEVTHEDYIKGISDLTGELMKMCLRGATELERKFFFKALAVSQAFHKELISIHPYPFELRDKIDVIGDNVLKMEKYLLKLRLVMNEFHVDTEAERLLGPVIGALSSLTFERMDNVGEQY